MSTAGLVALGVAVGVMSAMLGIGGGIILVPALILLFGLSQAEAQGTSLATIPFGAIIAALVVNQNTPLRANAIISVAVGIAAGAFVGAKLVPYVPEVALRSAFGGLLLYLGFLFVFDWRPTHPAGLFLVPINLAAGWVLRRLRFKSAPPAQPVDGHEYYI